MPRPAPSGLPERLFQADYWGSLVADIVIGLILPPGAPSELGALCLQAAIGPEVRTKGVIDGFARVLIRARSFALKLAPRAT